MRRIAPLRAIRRQALKGESLGLSGERIAARALRRAGLRQLGTRLKTREAELDILMLDRETLVAVEVKTGRSRLDPTDFGSRPTWRPGHRFGAEDLTRVRRATARIAERQDRPYRVDLVELVLFERTTRIYHHIDIEHPLPHPAGGAFGTVLEP